MAAKSQSNDDESTAYSGQERRREQRVWLTDEQIELIAERAAARALENFYFEVGKVTIRSALYLLGALCLALLGWFGVFEKIDLGKVLKSDASRIETKLV